MYRGSTPLSGAMHNSVQIYTNQKMSMSLKEKFEKRCKQVGEYTASERQCMLLDSMSHILDPEWAEKSWDIWMEREEALIIIAAIYTYSGWAKDAVQEMVGKHHTGITPFEII